jgi:hypothetical protein
LSRSDDVNFLAVAGRRRAEVRTSVKGGLEIDLIRSKKEILTLTNLSLGVSLRCSVALNQKW